jgi:hypothetical protein
VKRSQSVQDALADAETLVRYELQHCIHRTAWDAGYIGNCAANFAVAGQRELARHDAMAAARAAFRAVPALRAAQQEEA